MKLNEKNQLANELYALVEGKAKKLIFAHDTVRVFQCLLALKNAEIRSKLFDELKCNFTCRITFCLLTFYLLQF